MSPQEEVDAFARDGQHPRFEEVRERMGELLSEAAGRGKIMTLEEAYKRACRKRRASELTLCGSCGRAL